MFILSTEVNKYICETFAGRSLFNDIVCLFVATIHSSGLTFIVQRREGNLWASHIQNKIERYSRLFFPFFFFLASAAHEAEHCEFLSGIVSSIPLADRAFLACIANSATMDTTPLAPTETDGSCVASHSNIGATHFGRWHDNPRRANSVIDYIERRSARPSRDPERVRLPKIHRFVCLRASTMHTTTPKRTD